MATKRKSKKQKEQEERAFAGYLKDLERHTKGIIKDKYPNVSLIRFEMIYNDYDHLTSTKNEAFEVNLDQYADFNFSCPYTECIDGGHNLDMFVYDMIINHKHEDTGTIECQGWQDSERIHQHRCLCTLNYKIIIEYNDENANMNM